MQPPKHTHTDTYTHLYSVCVSLQRLHGPAVPFQKANKPKTRESLKALCETFNDEDHAHTV